MLHQRPLAVDVFAGAGGLSLGFEQAGFDIVAAVEKDPIHAVVHKFNFPYSTTFCRDVNAVTGEIVRNQSQLRDRELHVVIGGAPCQGFSMIGKRQLDDPRNALLAEFARLVLELRPRYAVLENVAGLIRGNHRLLLNEIIELFEANDNYRVLLPYRVLQAAQYGTPQSRERLFLIAARTDVPLPAYPGPSHTPRRIDGGAVTGDLPVGPSVWEAIGDLPDADKYEELLHRDSVIARYAQPSDYAAELRGLSRSAGDLSYLRPVEDKLLTSSLRTVHTRVSIQRFAATQPGTTEKISRFLRLHPDGIANTLRAGTDTERGAYTSPRPIHPKRPRVITVREAARLHGYPDWFRFHVTKWHGFRQIGNSVPPHLACAVATAILQADSTLPTRGIEIELGAHGLLSMTETQAERYFGFTQKVIPPRVRKASNA
jgi:DNA (cytosine-5)-methyltransferase 1